MRPGRESRTSALVAAGRAAAHGAPWANGFSDPVAESLLPEDLRNGLRKYRAGEKPARFTERARLGYLASLARLMAVRTVAVDQAIRAVHSPQVVILGAGLDARAWRMPELRDAIVFEVDHPDTQSDKKMRIAARDPLAREVRFVPVDFISDSLDDALGRAGHDPQLPTTWIWEGVVMYLEPAQVEATLAVIARRSAERSRLVIVYHAPALILHFVGQLLRGVGEPLRSKYKPRAMKALLEKYGFRVAGDDGIPELGASWPEQVAKATRKLKHHRMVIADR